MNYHFLAGHLGADPEVRFTSGGQKVTTLRVATRARKDETIWWKVTIWGDQFEKMMPYFKKGSAIMVMGEMMKPEIFTDREGKPQISLQMTAHNISFSPFGKGGKGEEGGSPQPSAMMNQFAMGAMHTNKGEDMAQDGGFTDDEIPF